MQAAFQGAALQQHAHYQLSPKLIMKLLNALKFYPENAFNEVCLDLSLASVKL